MTVARHAARALGRHAAFAAPANPERARALAHVFPTRCAASWSALAAPSRAAGPSRPAPAAIADALRLAASTPRASSVVSAAAVRAPQLALQLGPAARRALMSTAVSGAPPAAASSSSSSSRVLLRDLPHRDHHPLVAGPDVARWRVGVWLGGGVAWVFSMVVLGGVTRLTRSGLSMTDWRFEWESPPLTDGDWSREFDKYRASPEFRKTNSKMTVAEYKRIYWMEYAHRMWGRGLGVYFAVPLAYFCLKGYVRPALLMRLGGFFAAGAAQAGVGWWMVRSGLDDALIVGGEHAAPRVSPYRLATHLTGAFAIYAAMFWTTLDVWFPNPSPDFSKSSASSSSARTLETLRPDFSKSSATLRAASTRAKALAALVGATALSGAYVAGLDAGRAYNTFPLMGGRIVPEEYWDPAFFPTERSGDHPDRALANVGDRVRLGARNFFENTAAVQFDHRVLAMSTLAATTATWLTTRNNARLPLPARHAAAATAAVAALQAGLGVAALLHHVPASLGAAHQANALVLFSCVLGLVHALRGPRRAPKGPLAGS
jgi:cytochrome c oxidase assembly protein subunit 15